MSLLEVTEVSLVNTEHVLIGHGLDRPASGQISAFFGFDVRGWAVGRHSSAETVVLRHAGRELRTVPVTGERPDVAEQFPDSAWAQRSGFFVPVGGLKLEPSFELDLSVRLTDGNEASFAAITGRRPLLRTAFEPSIDPICLTALGRTGSTAVTRLLSRHPMIAAYRPFEYEPRIVTYWIDALKELAEPAAFRRQIAPNGPLTGNWWVGEREPFPRRLMDEDVQAWLGGKSIEALAVFCQTRIDSIYTRIAERFERPGATYFVEKLGPDTGALVRELYPRAREVFLVRDFRDVVASIFAFNDKRGIQGFNRADAASDAAYVSDWVSESAASFLRAWRTRSAGAHLIRYEDLVRQPRAVLVETLDYLELDTPPATIDAMLKSLDDPASDVHRTTAAEESIGRWRRDLPDDVRDTCRSALGEALAEFGYLP
jgi:hypothetical protein